MSDVCNRWMWMAIFPLIAFSGASGRLFGQQLGCGGITPQIVTPVYTNAPRTITFAISGVTAPLLQIDVAHASSVTTYPATNLGSGNWSFALNTGTLPTVGVYQVIAWNVNGGSRTICDESFVQIATPPPPQPLPGPCASAAGQWTMSFPDFPGFTANLNLTQNAQNALSGSLVQNPECGGQFSWSVSGSYNPTSASASIAASNPQPRAIGQCQASLLISQTGTVTKPGCNTVNGNSVSTLPDGSQVSGTFKWTKSCEVPNSETTAFVGWDTAEGYDTEGMFKATLNSTAGITFGGRAVQELDAGGASDGCYFAGSAIAPVLGLTGGFWPVGNNNSYGNDYVGFPPAIVTYYRLYRWRQGGGANVPCTVTARQRMVINACVAGGTPTPYGGAETGNTNTLSFGSSDTQTVFSRRGPVQQSKIFIP